MSTPCIGWRIRIIITVVIVLVLVTGCGKAEPTTSAMATISAPVVTATATPTSEASLPAATPSPSKEPEPTSAHAWRSEEIEFTNGPITLAGTLHLPEGPGPHPAVIFVHGGDAANRDCWGYYRPIFDEFLEAGFACLAWDKPGVGESTRPGGDYDDAESFFERATEVRKAMDFLKNRAEIDPDRIGLWGISRAGWIMSMFASRAKDVAFVIAISCAGTDSHLQSAYQTRCHAQGDDCSENTIIADLNRQGPRSHPVPDAPDGFWEHLAGDNPGYVSDPAVRAYQDGSYSIDARPFLEQITCPVLALYGEHDQEVPPFESARIYQDALEEADNPDVSVGVFPNAGHPLLQTSKMDEIASYWARGELPYAPGYLETMSIWLVERFIEP